MSLGLLPWEGALYFGSDLGHLTHLTQERSERFSMLQDQTGSCRLFVDTIGSLPRRHSVIRLRIWSSEIQ